MIRVRVTADPKLARTMKKLQDPALVEKMLETRIPEQAKPAQTKSVLASDGFEEDIPF